MQEPPVVDRPDMPASYGPTDGTESMLAWEWVEARLTAARNYWIATTRDGGTPHVMPVWGVLVRGSVWFGTDPDSTKGRNLARDDRLVVHLESGDEAVIVEARVRIAPFDRLAEDLARELDDAFAAKYVDGVTGEPFRFSTAPPGSLIYEAVPQRVLAWNEQDFPRSRTRWTFPGAWRTSA